MKITASADRCIAAGNCALIAPEVFDQSDEDGTVAVLDDSPPVEAHDTVRQAAAACPAAVIHIDD
ncbi:ferredoxin [Pseudonocardia xishanensis]|uniref:Ferredoxin n=1 Tax=Pseudonocardia xishanensis TaxID=630995 RepID=A0ABP8RZI4_9PSEU